MTGVVWQQGEARVRQEHVCQGGRAAVTSARSRALAEHVSAGPGTLHREELWG